MYFSILFIKCFLRSQKILSIIDVMWINALTMDFIQFSYKTKDYLLPVKLFLSSMDFVNAGVAMNSLFTVSWTWIFPEMSLSMMCSPYPTTCLILTIFVCSMTSVNFCDCQVLIWNGNTIRCLITHLAKQFTLLISIKLNTFCHKAAVFVKCCRDL